jgi:hypothetical protein
LTMIMISFFAIFRRPSPNDARYATVLIDLGQCRRPSIYVNVADNRLHIPKSE